VEWLRKMPTDTEGVIEVLDDYYHLSPGAGLAALEEQQPRPTFWIDRESGKGRSSILRSTVILYGSYRLLKGMLLGRGIHFTEVLPASWQKHLGITPKGRHKGATAWKNELKSLACSLFPGARVTLATSDALLLAEYARRAAGSGGA
jgi:hypothetical protein